MDTEPQSSQRNHPVYVPTRMRCSRCGADTPKQNISYRNPQTGEQKDDKGLPACLIMIVGYLAVAIVLSLPVIGFIYLTGAPSYDGDVLIGCYPIALAGAIAAIPLYRAWRRNRLSKTYLKIGHFTCKHCGGRWEVVQEPTAK